MSESGETPGVRPMRGRGAVSQPPARYEPTSTEVCDDGWGGIEQELAPRQVATQVQPEATRRIISRNDSPDIPFSRSINPYKGCEHGCIYCFARPTHAYLGLSPGLDFETKLVAKTEAPAALARELARPSYQPEEIALGANTDPYQPVERRLRITRGILEVLWQHRHPVLVVSKSQLILRDLDLLAPMAQQGLVAVRISLTTLDPRLARAMEPRAPSPQVRLRTIEQLAAAGVPTGVLTSPMIPAINDGELEALLAAASGAGAVGGCYALLRLPLELKEIFSDWLSVHFPQRKERVLSLIRSCRDGALNQARFGERMRGGGPYAEMLESRFDAACRRLGLRREPSGLRTDAFVRGGADRKQLSLF